eukprot:jgi/Botrbrau1/17890/Bobra.0464s0001.1
MMYMRGQLPFRWRDFEPAEFAACTASSKYLFLMLQHRQRSFRQQVWTPSKHRIHMRNRSEQLCAYAHALARAFCLPRQAAIILSLLSTTPVSCFTSLHLPLSSPSKEQWR